MDLARVQQVIPLPWGGSNLLTRTLRSFASHYHDKKPDNNAMVKEKQLNELRGRAVPRCERTIPVLSLRRSPCCLFQSFLAKRFRLLPDLTLETLVG